MPYWLRPALGTVTFFITIYGVLWAVEPSACIDAKISTISNQQNVPVFSCWEFWFNRYQGLLGNLATAGVAFWTLRWIKLQLETSDRQTAVAASQALRARVKDLEVEVQRFTKAIDYATGAKNSAFGTAKSRVNIRRVDLASMAANYPDMAKNVLEAIQYNYIDGLRDESSAAIGFAIAFRDQTKEFADKLKQFSPISKDPNVRSFEVVARSDGDELERICLEQSAASERILEVLQGFKEASLGDLEETWFRIRDFEDRAVRRKDWAKRKLS